MTSVVSPAIVWDTSTTSSAGTSRRSRRSTWTFPVETAVSPDPADARVGGLRYCIDAAASRIEHLLDLISRPTFARLHAGSPMETTRIATTSRRDAAEILEHTTTIEWGSGRGVCHLRLGRFDTLATEFGRPDVADAVLVPGRARDLRVTVAIFDHGHGRCAIQIRPGYRRPWSTRRLRRCLRITHGASVRLRELVEAVDYSPPAAERS